MNRNKLYELFLKIGVVVRLLTFLEDGYEIVIRTDENADIDKISSLKIEGFSILSVTKRIEGYMTLVIVPITMDEMTDFMWRYVEKFGNKDERLIDILGNAICCLEKAIGNLEEGKEKQEALANFEKFTSQIF